MKTTFALGTAAAVLGLTVACGGNTAREDDREQDTRTTAITDNDDVRPAPTIVTGCLTEANGRFALTTLGDSTETYQLTNGEDQLRQYIGREVRISGESSPEQVAEVRESTPGAAPSAVGTAGQQAPERGDASPGASVSTEARTRLETGRLSVIAVTPTGDECTEVAAPERPAR